MVAANRSVLALSYTHDRSRGIVQELPFENRRKVEGQGEQGRRVQEAEDAEIILVMAPTNDLGILFLATTEFGRNA